MLIGLEQTGIARLFSFEIDQNITSGEGGMIVCDDEHLYQRCFAAHDLGYARDDSGRLDPTDNRYQLWGVGSRMHELAAAMALAQFGKLKKITVSMRKAKWTVRKRLESIPGMEFRNILDPMGDSGPLLITIYRSPAICHRFTAALQAEGIRGPEGSMACTLMQQRGPDWYFNHPSLVKRRSNSADGWPWSHPANRFALDDAYAKGALPVCDDLADRTAFLVRLMQTLKGRPMVRRQLRFEDAIVFKQYIDSLLDLADRVERLAPRAAGTSQPNPEYPWGDPASPERFPHRWTSTSPCSISAMRR